MYNNLKGKTLILGVGAQKAGTSWLFNYLSQHPQVSCSELKEVHFFDAWLNPDLCGGFNEHFVKRLNSATSNPRKFLKRKDSEGLLNRVLMTNDPDKYLDYLNRQNYDNKDFICEITPSYSTLNSLSFSTVRDLLLQVGLNVKIVFLMRDPIDRYYSNLRMQERSSQGKLNAKSRFKIDIFKKQNFERGQYHKTIQAIESVFSKNQFYIGFYENLFSKDDKYLKEITDFIGIDYIESDKNKIVNGSPLNDSLDATEISYALDAFSESYAFINERFSDTKPKSWAA